MNSQLQSKLQQLEQQLTEKEKEMNILRAQVVQQQQSVSPPQPRQQLLPLPFNATAPSANARSSPDTTTPTASVASLSYETSDRSDSSSTGSKRQKISGRNRRLSSDTATTMPLPTDTEMQEELFDTDDSISPHSTHYSSYESQQPRSIYQPQPSYPQSLFFNSPYISSSTPAISYPSPYESSLNSLDMAYQSQTQKMLHHQEQIQQKFDRHAQLYMEQVEKRYETQIEVEVLRERERLREKQIEKIQEQERRQSLFAPVNSTPPSTIVHPIVNMYSTAPSTPPSPQPGFVLAPPPIPTIPPGFKITPLSRRDKQHLKQATKKQSRATTPVPPQQPHFAQSSSAFAPARQLPYPHHSYHHTPQYRY